MNKKENWREKRVRRVRDGLDWRVGLYKEFIEFIDEVYELSNIYDWDIWGGGTDNYAVTLTQAKRNGKFISIKMIPSKNYSYYASFVDEWNLNRIKNDSIYEEFIGDTLDEALKYIHKFLNENEYQREYGSPTKILGNGYDKCFMRIRWAKDEFANKIIEDEFSNI